MPLINVTIPVCNEAQCLAANVRAVASFLEQSRENYELVIANNGSRDGTEAIARELEAENDRIRVVSLCRSGRGRALRAAWQTSRASILSYMDVDLSTDLECFGALIEPLRNSSADLAIGSRRMSGSKTQRGWYREGISRGYIRLCQAILGLEISDFQCGFKAIRRSAARSLLPQVRDDHWFFDTELITLAHRNHYCVREVPVDWREDRDSRVRVLKTAAANIRGLTRLRWQHRQGAREARRCLK